MQIIHKTYEHVKTTYIISRQVNIFRSGYQVGGSEADQDADKPARKESVRVKRLFVRGSPEISWGYTESLCDISLGSLFEKADGPGDLLTAIA